MTDDVPNTGPSRETLRKLKGTMESYIADMNKGVTKPKGKPVLVRRPRKVCKVCGECFDHAMMRPDADQEIVPTLCDKCDGYLKEGLIAFVCGDKFAFAKSPNLTDMSGTIVRVSPYVMEQIEANFGAQKKANINGNANN